MTYLAKTINLKKCLPVLLIAAAMVVGVTGATVIHKLTMENPIKTPTVEGSIPEELENGTKKVKFTNDGEADVFLRVAFSETWTAKDGTILPNETKLTANAQEAKPVATPKLQLDDWDTGRGDGWYYYTKILPGSRSGQTNHSTGWIVENVDFEDLTQIPDTRYRDAHYEIHFVMEMVQASDDWGVSQDAVEKMFGIDLGETAPDNWDTNKYEATISWPNE